LRSVFLRFLIESPFYASIKGAWKWGVDPIINLKTMKNFLVILVTILIFTILGVALYFGLQKAENLPVGGDSQVIDSGQIISRGVIVTKDLLSATSTDATSTSMNIVGAKRVSVYGIRGGVMTGTPVLSLTATGIATSTATTSKPYFDYIRYSKLIDNVVNSNSQTLTRLETKGLTSTTTLLSMDLEHDIVPNIRCHIGAVTAGDVTCRVIVEY